MTDEKFQYKLLEESIVITAKLEQQIKDMQNDPDLEDRDELLEVTNNMLNFSRQMIINQNKNLDGTLTEEDEQALNQLREIAKESCKKAGI